MTENIIKDSRFEEGFLLKGLNSLRDGHDSIGEIRFNGGKPVWYLCQWNSRYNLLDGKRTQGPEGIRICDRGKSLTVRPDGELIFRVNASEEYDAPRKIDEGWPHLLVEQNIDCRNRVSEMEGICLNGSFRLREFKDYMNGSGRDFHTAQFVWVTVFQNANPISSDFGRFMWVVLGIFDSRYDFVPRYCAQDTALPDGEFIYSFPGKAFLEHSLKEGGEERVSFDLYPHIPLMLKEAQNAGFLPHTAVSDLALVGTNMGFEVTGTYDVEISARDIALMVRNKDSGGTMR